MAFADVALAELSAGSSQDLTGNYSMQVDGDSDDEDSHDLSNLYVSHQNVPLGTTPSAESLDLKVYPYGIDEYDYDYDYDDDVELLEYGVDYEISGWYAYSNYYDFEKLSAAPTAVGQYYVELTGKGDYTGSQRVYFRVIDTYDVSQLEAYADNVRVGTVLSADSLRLRVYPYDWYYYDESALAYGEDYEITGWYNWDETTRDYVQLEAAPTEIGTYYCQISGVNRYHGSRYVGFRILDPYNLSDCFHASANDISLGTIPDADTLGLRVVDGDDSAVTLKYGTDYEISSWYSYDYDYENSLLRLPKSGYTASS